MSVTVTVTGGPSTAVPYQSGMNAQMALEQAWVLLNPTPMPTPPVFTYALQYFGGFGYLVMMINETYETYYSASTPYFYWDFYYNGQHAPGGIDSTLLNDGDTILFAFEPYTPGPVAPSSWKRLKHALRSP